MDLIAVRHTSRSPDPGAWRRRDHVVRNEDAVLTLKDIERFVLSAMHMERGLGPSSVRFVPAYRTTRPGQ